MELFYTMWIGIVSDTHGHANFAQDATYVLESFSVEQVLHCGDIGSTGVVEVFARWPTHYVVGNIDDNLPVLKEAIAAHGGHYHGMWARLEIAQRKIAMTHGHDQTLVEELASDLHLDLLCQGHTHQATLEKIDDTWRINPGALYRAKRHTICVMNLQTMEPHLAEV